MSSCVPHLETAAIRLFADGLEGAVLVRGVGLAMEQSGYGVRHNVPVPSYHNGMLVAHATADLLISGDTAVLFSATATPTSLREARLQQWLSATQLAAVISVEPASDPMVLAFRK